MPFHIDGEEGVSEEVRDWFQSRRISYFHDQEKGMVFLQMCSTKCPATRGAAVAGKGEKVNLGLDSVIDELEVRELQGLLFMFTVSFLLHTFCAFILIQVKLTADWSWMECIAQSHLNYVRRFFSKVI